ncbi:MAG: hypothetical protein ACSLFN_09380 [Candidatus Limnocylindrales bacterium]
MRRRRKIVRWITRSLATAAIGSLLGFLIPTIAADLAPKPEVEAVVAESPVARQFINAFTADDQGAITTMGVAADVPRDTGEAWAPPTPPSDPEAQQPAARVPGSGGMGSDVIPPWARG